MHSFPKIIHCRAVFRGLGAAALTLALAACPGNPDDTGADTELTDGGSTSAVSATTGTSDIGTSDTGDEPTGGSSASGTGDGTSTGGSDESTSGGTESGGDSVEEACQAQCETLHGCDPVIPVDECTEGCIDEYSASPACTQAGTIAANCVAGLTCEQIEELYTDFWMACKPEVTEAQDTCAAAGCVFIEGEDEPCYLSRECGHSETVEKYECDGGTCTCSVNGVPGESCPEEFFCMLDDDDQKQAGAECCGFDW